MTMAIRLTIREEIENLMMKYVQGFEGEVSKERERIISQLRQQAPADIDGLIMLLDEEINHEIWQYCVQMFEYGYRCGRNPDLLIFECSQRHGQRLGWQT